MSWHLGLGSCAVDSLQHSWRILYACAFPPFCLIGKVLAKVRKDQSLLLIVTPTWQTQPWYAALLAMSVQHYSTQSEHTVTRSSGAKAPFAGRQPATIGGMESFKKVLEGEGVSKLAATLITNSRRSGSISNYQSAWRKWASWCYEREVNPFTSNIIEILKFPGIFLRKRV